MDVLFAAEQGARKYRPVTVETMKQEIAFMANRETSLSGIDKLDPAAMFYAPKRFGVDPSPAFAVLSHGGWPLRNGSTEVGDKLLWILSNLPAHLR
jgi:hypothetical protein